MSSDTLSAMHEQAKAIHHLCWSFSFYLTNARRYFFKKKCFQFLALDGCFKSATISLAFIRRQYKLRNEFFGCLQSTIMKPKVPTVYHCWFIYGATSYSVVTVRRSLIYHRLQLLYTSVYREQTFPASPYIFPIIVQAAYLQYLEQFDRNATYYV